MVPNTVVWSTANLSAIVLFEYHPLFLLFVGVGFLLPNVDALDESMHRSWIFHTFLAPAVVYQVVIHTPLQSLVPVYVLHFISIGIALHLFVDFVYPRTLSHDGAEWPVRPTIGSEPWGLLLLGLSWFVQWFIYLSSAFIPWLVGV